jgi:hypothetical protein
MRWKGASVEPTGAPDVLVVTSSAAHAEALVTERQKPFQPQLGPDGSGQDLCDEDYAVINFRGEEVFRIHSSIEAERWIAETARFFSGPRNAR